MKYLLDTNTCVRYINGRAPRLRANFLRISDDDIAVSSITKAEMYYGSSKSQTPERSREKQDDFFQRFVSLPFDDSAADRYGSLRARLEATGTPIGAYDLMIAALALVHNLVVVTHNVGEFSRIAELNIEDWEI